MKFEPMQFFGDAYPSDRYPAPIYVGIARVEAPVGELCWDCEEPIEEGDRGFIQTCFFRKGENGEYIGTREPIHHECHIRSSIGSAKHQRGECGCATGDFSGNDDAEYSSRREAAKAALAEFEGKYGLANY